MFKVILKKRLENSIYEILETREYLYVGGSDWDRRKIKYSKKIANNSQGILWIFKKNKGKLNLMKKVFFPSMVYEIRKLNNKILVACKSAKETLNILSKEGEKLFIKNEKIGKGVYGLEKDKKSKLIVLTTREGYLLWINPDNL